tara:strand:+ start:12360 stop:13268 length:909 start_codon:yes stop_codon:yes gene_type:complete
MKVLLKDIWALIKTTLNKSGEDEIFTFGAAIAFYTIFSIAPLLILVLSISGYFMNQGTILEQIRIVGGDFMDESMINSLNEFAQNRINEGAGILTSIIATFVIIFGATTVISQLKVALNKIWNVRVVKINSIYNFMYNRGLSFLMILMFSTLFVTSLIAESVLIVISDLLTDHWPAINLNYLMNATKVGTIGFATLSFTLIFKILPDVRARWSDVLVGGIVTTLLFLLGKYLIGVYFSAAGIDAAYRAAGSLIVFVIWVYYNSLIILVGAVFTQVYTEKFGGKILPYRFVTLEGVPTLERRE